MDAKRKQQPQWQKVIVTCSGLCSSPVSVLGLENSQREKICSFLTKLNSCPQTGNWNHSHTTGLFSLNRCSMYWIYSNTGFQEMPAVTHIKLSAIQRQCFHWQQPQSLVPLWWVWVLLVYLHSHVHTFRNTQLRHLHSVAVQTQAEEPKSEYQLWLDSVRNELSKKMGRGIDRICALQSSLLARAQEQSVTLFF